MDLVLSEERGLAAMLRHDRDFSEFFHTTWPRLYRTALGIAGDPGLAEDSLQSAFAKAYASWGRISSADRPEAYVRRMVVNEVIDARRGGWWKRERPHEDVRPASLPDAGSQVVEHLTLWDAVRSLPVRQRAVIVLRYYEDLTEVQIAEALGCSTGTVKSQAAAALGNLRRRSGLDLSDVEGGTR